jgi:hypothetical protein
MLRCPVLVLHPVVHFRQFEPEKTAYPMRREALGFCPSVNGILADLKMVGHVFNADPFFLDH